MKIEKHERSNSTVLAPTLVVKISLCLWMAGVMFVFLVLFVPPEYLINTDRLDIRTWVLELRNLIQPLFSDSNPNYPLPWHNLK